MSKVLIVFNHPAPYKVKLFNELSKYIDLTVIFERDSASDRNKTFYSETEYKFKTVKISGLKIGRENRLSNGVLKHIKNNSYDLIIMNGYSMFPEMKALNYLIKHSIPYTLYINGGIAKEKENPIKRNLKKKYISNAKYYFSPDESSNKYLEFYGADKSKIYTYPYSTIYANEVLPLPYDQQAKNEMRLSASILEEKVFVSCGQLIKRKNYFELIKRWKDFDAKYGLYIIGDGKQKNELQKYIDDNKIKNVHLLGYMNRKDMFSFYHLSDCFIFPSDEDIYGHVINEAMSQGLPVISTPNVNASKKLIKDGYNGYIIKSIESKDLEQSIHNVLVSNLAKNAIETAYQNTIEKMVEAHLEILKRIL